MPKANLSIIELEGSDPLTVRSDVELEPAFQVGDVLDRGDLVWVSETLADVRLLAPSLNEEFELSRPFDHAKAKQWNLFLERMREFFKARDFIEVRTPTLVPSPGLEPFLDPFHADFVHGKDLTHFYLPTSPEFHLKKLLTLGWRKIFEFKECFRNGELSSHHQPEFLMLEWYRAYAGFGEMIQDVKDLLVFLQERFAHKKHFETITVTTVVALFKDLVEIDLRPDSIATDLARECERLGVHFEAADSFDDLFARIFLEKIEPRLAVAPSPIIVRGYPPSQAALARIGADGWAERFELYWRGFELANAFHELNDPHEQRRRFDENIREKKRLKRVEVPVDREFLAALDRGMPPSVGIALGVERLFLAFAGQNELEQARAFPIRVPR
ncbi:MAG: EF-P lysine aminoacylase EpmA [Bdellovibrionia bacterium]